MNISAIINHNRKYMVKLMEEIDVEQGQLWYEKGLEHLKSGNLSGVMECFRNALYFYPNFAEVHNTIGMIQFQIEKYENAIQLFDNALAMNPNFAEAYNNRGLARSKICHKSEFPKVIEDYTKAIALNPNLVQAYLNRADTYKNLTGDNPAAILDYNQVILLDPNCLSAYINRANIYFLCGELESSLSDLEKALSLDAAKSRSILWTRDSQISSGRY
ncbi:MAG: tetratricopeptide repeat protein [Nostoc sp. NMS1]|uniref:tetratricopeptide repeat protein n=1 Tax=unclassified Nostoc TaxID=2593658 RepID=UPI0025CB7EB7|nr:MULTISPECIES: tetratricopeptide repeat protein [unclassified Nostoc]MBN3907084.1 tetratricopeptide repeat protein [Nostoc sp. NMS1]MBN3992996.1 tetratricopeptide repeat protein [Nostoc sp. NMS2]